MTAPLLVPDVPGPMPHDGPTLNGRTSVDVVRPMQPALLVNRNVPELLGRYGQAPDPPRDSDVANRRSMKQIVFYFLPGGGYWEEPSLGGKLAMAPHLASQPRGMMLSDAERVNTDRPFSGTTAETIDQWDPSYAYAPSMPGA